MFAYHKFPLFNKYVFFNPSEKKGHMFRFSSDIEKIGLEWDVSLANGSYVDVISDPIQINRAPYGDMSIVKIKADVAADYHTVVKEFWVPTMCIYKVEEDEAASPQLSN